MPDFLKSLTLNGAEVGGGGGSVTATQVEIDVGATPVGEAEVTVTNGAVTTASKIFAAVSTDAPTGKDADDAPMDFYIVQAEAAAGEIIFRLYSPTGLLHDRYLIDYLIG
jgi:hypothetical protein